jgi:hypothetical protein
LGASSWLWANLKWSKVSIVDLPGINSNRPEQ